MRPREDAEWGRWLCCCWGIQVGCCGPQVIVSSVTAVLLGNTDSTRRQQTSLTHPSSLGVVFHFFSISLFSSPVQTTWRHTLSFIDTPHEDAFACDFQQSETYILLFFTRLRTMSTAALVHSMTYSFWARVIKAVPKHELYVALRNKLPFGAKRTSECPAMCFFFLQSWWGKGGE